MAEGKTYRELVSEAVMGDEASTDAIAERLALLDEALGRNELHSPESRELQQLRAARANLEEATRNSLTWNAMKPVHQYTDQNISPPEAYEEVKNYQAYLAKQTNPDGSRRYSFAQTIEKADQWAYEKYGPIESYGTTQYVQQRQKDRGQTSLDYSDDERIADMANENDAEASQSEGVAEVIAERRRIHEQLAERYRRAPDDQPRARRASEFPDGGPRLYVYDSHGNRIA